MSSPDEVIPVALALHNSPRRYALLVGSGISQGAGIPTAGDITDDLIRQIAGKGIKSGQHPQDWYKETHNGRAPTFSRLFEELTRSYDDRKAILSRYFEPDITTGQSQKIAPTPAHLSIARLVRDGIISMIVTTNFDPLIEEAIKQETGKTPIVITYESSPRVMGVAGDDCRIVMINGRYPTTELKLTPEDLARYDGKDVELANYLSRIFSEYGLLICGWSGEHDIGLVDILVTKRPCRFAIFWCTRDSPDKIPSEIRSKLNPSIVGIVSANEFFEDLESRIDIFRRHERIAPLSAESAIKKAKDAFRDLRPEMVLSDLLRDETDRILSEVNRSDFVSQGPIDEKSCFKNRLEELERISAPLVAMVATISYYDDGTYSDLITETIDRLINLQAIDLSFLHDGQRVNGTYGTNLNKYLNNLRFYPALLVIYASGITAVHKGNFNSLSAILEKPRERKYDPDVLFAWKYFPYIEDVNFWSVLWTSEQWILDFCLERFGIREDPISYPAKVIHNIIKPLIPSEIYFDSAFDVFEYLSGLSYLNAHDEVVTSPSNPLWSRVWIHSGGFSREGVKMKFPSPVKAYLMNIGKKIKGSDFFNGDENQFLRCVWIHAKIFHMDTAPETDIPLPRGGFPGL
jgi:hypothetical protein